ncbi:MAG: methyl-accepting chemotaxis protein [Halothece sp.]
MTNLKNVSESQSSQTTTQNGANHYSVVEERSSTTQQSTPAKSSQASTLQSRLLVSVLPTLLVPLAVAGTAGWWIIHEQLENQYKARLEEQALIAGEDMSQWLRNYLAVAETITQNAMVVEAVRSGSNQVVTEEINLAGVRELEEQFQETKLLNPNTDLNEYLQQITSAHEISEIIITEKNGLNVGYNVITSDFVQKGEPWWEDGKSQGVAIGELEYDDSTATDVIPLMHSIEDLETNTFLGVIKMGIPFSSLQTIEATLEHSGLLPTAQVQVFNTSNSQTLVTVGTEGRIQDASLEGGNPLEVLAAAMVENIEAEESSRDETLGAIAAAYNFKEYSFASHDHEQDVASQEDAPIEQEIIQANLIYNGRNYQLATVPETDWVSIASVEEQVLQSAGNELISVFATAGAILAALGAGVAFILARQLSSPLIDVSQSAQKAAGGDLSVRAQPQGSYETQVLAESYNNLVERVQQLLKEQEETATQQRQQREELEAEVVQLMSDIEDASEGDLTVRAQLMEGDIGIVADLFNAVIENLQETAQQVKTAASQVNTSLGENEVEIRQLAEGAIAEAEEIQSTLKSIAQMNTSIQEVSGNAQKAASIADTALTTAQEGNQAMDQTVQTIQSLRATVGETSKKMKQMGESAQKISQVVSLIDEISLKTSLLAINASVEANRAGELGQGFTAVAEQVEALAEQSASAAKEISQIVANIQQETQEAIETMEQGTSEVVESTRSVEETQARLSDVVERSEEINTLMQSISRSTVSQAETSQAVARLMEQVANSSQNRSQTSQEVAQAIQETAQVSKRLEESVQGFKVEKE